MPEPLNTAKDIFLAALEQPADRRPTFVDGACRGDDALQRHVEALLQAHNEPDSVLDQHRIDPRVTADSDAQPEATVGLESITQPGTQIGPYKLLQRLGEGGMGMVYMAQQSEPVKRQVAIKIIKPGMDSRQVIARFEAERQALALMDHPNIAKVLDAAATDFGQPYFVMELVKGVPVTEYCDEQHLTPRERLQLFIPICQAVQHAHQKGIIHRDLKPSNVLVALYDGEPVPKVIDFGIAKATNQQLTEKTLFTAVGSILGTWEYMSPEQAQVNQLDVDTRSDIYSLGVLLYELLTGVTPLDRQRLRSAAFDEMMRIIREEEPPRPSLRLSTIDTLPSVAASRRTDPHKLRVLVRGELDWIVMKALEKDRSRRYETVNGLALDIQHFLDDEPVLACPPSPLYRFRKFARRHKAAFVTATLVAAALLLGLVGTSWQAIVATRQRTRAGIEANRADRAAERLRAQLQVANATRLAAQSQAIRDQLPSLSMLLAMEAVNVSWRNDKTVVPVAHEALFNRVALIGGRTFKGHTSNLSRTQMSPDGRWLVSGYYDGTVIVHDMTARDPTTTARVLSGHDDFIAAVALSPDERWLATGSRDGTARLWDLGVFNANLSARMLDGHDGSVGEIAFSPDSRWLVSGCDDGLARLWHLDGVETAELEPRILRGNEDRIGAVSFSPDGNWLATGGYSDRRTHIWDLTADEPGATSLELRGAFPENNGLELIWANNSRWLGTLPNLGVPVLWDLEADEPQSTGLRLTHDLETETFFEVAVSRDSRWLVTGAGGDNTARIWDLSLEDPSESPVILRGHKDDIFAVAVGPGNRWVVTGSRDNTARLWHLAADDPSARPLTLGHQDSVEAVLFSPDGHWLATGSNDGKARLWDLRADDVPNASVELTGHEFGGIHALFITPDIRWLVTQPSSGTPRLWDLTADAPAESPLRLGGHRDNLVDIATSPSGRWLVTAGWHTTARLWDISSEEPPTAPVVELPYDFALGPYRGCSSIAFSPDERWLALTGSADHVVRVSDLRGALSSSSASFELPHDHPANVVRFSPTGRWLITGSGFEEWPPNGSGVGEVRLWNMNAQDPTRSPIELVGHEYDILHLSMSADERWLAVGGNSAVAVWDLGSSGSQPVRHKLAVPPHPRGGRNGLGMLTISADGRWLAAGHVDNIVRVWELSDDGPSQVPRELKHPVWPYLLIWARDGRRLIVCCGQEVAVWGFTAQGPRSETDPLLVMDGHAGGIRSATLSKDGRWLVTGSDDQTARIWDLHAKDAASNSIALRGHQQEKTEQEVGNVAFAGRWLVTATRTSARLWDLNLETLLERAHRLAGREFFEDEIRQYHLPEVEEYARQGSRSRP